MVDAEASEGLGGGRVRELRAVFRDAILEPSALRNRAAAGTLFRLLPPSGAELMGTPLTTQ